VWGDTSVTVVRDGEGVPHHALGQVVDVSVEVANFEAMQRAAAELRLLAENASDVVLRVNEHGVITWVSPSVRTVLGWEPDVLVGTPSLSLIEHADHEKVISNRTAMREGTDGVPLVLRYRTTWGETRQLAGRVRPLRDETGAYRGGIEGLRDVTEEQAMRRELAYRATHDALTGVANRDDLLDRLRVRLGLDAGRGRPVGVLFLDVDNLKLVNDEHGHHVGDAVLVEIARRLTAAVRREDLVARLSGDEFVVVVENLEDTVGLGLVAEKCRTAVHGGIDVDGVLVPVSLSIGGVLAAPDERAEDLLVRADRAVYRAKHAGRDQVSIDPSP
jgi:diguanylate cyclase (GGDEF)-like protein/PAS domain S-box-containing protein